MWFSQRASSWKKHATATTVYVLNLVVAARTMLRQVACKQLASAMSCADMNSRFLNTANPIPKIGSAQLDEIAKGGWKLLGVAKTIPVDQVPVDGFTITSLLRTSTPLATMATAYTQGAVHSEAMVGDW